MTPREMIKVELTKKERMSVLKDFHRLGGVFVLFTGGEPYLINDLHELAEYAHELGLITSVTTNFSVPQDKDFPRMLEVFDYIGISIDSPNPEIYKEQRGVDWQNSRIVGEENTIGNKVRRLMKVAAEIKSPSSIVCMVTVTAQNVYQTARIIEYAMEDLRMDCISFEIEQIIESWQEFAPDGRRLKLSGEELESFAKIAQKYKSKYPINNSHWYLRSLRNLNYHCHPSQTIHLDPYGNILGSCLALCDEKNDLIQIGSPSGANGKRKFNVREYGGLKAAYEDLKLQKLYDEYDKCNKCVLQCVAETGKAYDDFAFVVNEVFLGKGLPMLQRIKQRNKSIIS